MATKHPETKTINLRKLIAEKKKVGRPRNSWITGSDPATHDKYVAWSKARAQAHFRGEVWSLSFDQWVDVWGTEWLQRGRGSHNLCLVRQDHSAAWDLSNIHIITRRQHCQRNARLSKGLE